MILDTGFSEAAQYLHKVEREERLRSAESFLLGARRDLFAQLQTVWEECRQPNWDGHDAHPVSSDTLTNAYRLIESLPAGFRLPTIGAEPDGQLTLEWYRDPMRTLSVSVSPDGQLHFAAILGSSKVYGTEPFFDELPTLIRDLVYRVFP